MLFENLMIGAFCCAVGTRLAHHIRKKSFADYCERFTLITLGIGFPWIDLEKSLREYFDDHALLHRCIPYLCDIGILLASKKLYAEHGGDRT